MTSYPSRHNRGRSCCVAPARRMETQRAAHGRNIHTPLQELRTAASLRQQSFLDCARQVELPERRTSPAAKNNYRCTNRILASRLLFLTAPSQARSDPFHFVRYRAHGPRNARTILSNIPPTTYLRSYRTVRDKFLPAACRY